LFAASTPSSRNLALVSLRGTPGLVVRDITDIDHPTTVGAISTASTPGFASPTSFGFASSSELSYVDPDGNLIRMAYGGSFASMTVAACVGSYVWSPRSTSLVYTSQDGSDLNVHQLGSGLDRLLGHVPAIPAVGCEAIASCSGADTWQWGLSYSPQGSYVSFVGNIANVSVFRVWASDGTLRSSNESQAPTWLVWSGDSLYYRDANGVEVWRDGAVSTFIPNLAWIRPSASAGGGQIAYETRDAQGWHQLNVLDISTKAVRVLTKGRTSATFLTPRYLWSMGERFCGASEGCDAHSSATLSGRTYIYDLQNGTETESIITGVADVWPHAG